MATTHEIQPGRRIELAQEVVGLDRADRLARIVEQQTGQAPERIDGFTIGAPRITGDAPHDGEVHPDGDELLFLISGAVTVTLELAAGDRLVELGAGEAVVVPRGVWHKITMRDPGQLIHITPGPHGDARPLARSAREREPLAGQAEATGATPSTDRRPLVLSPGEGRNYAMGRVSAVFKADGAETAGRYSISEWWLEPHTKGPGAHTHPEDDVFFVLDGTMSFLVHDEWVDASAGSFVLVPGGATHTFENLGDTRAGALNISAPGDFEARMPAIADWFRQRPPGDADC